MKLSTQVSNTRGKSLHIINGNNNNNNNNASLKNHDQRSNMSSEVIVEHVDSEQVLIIQGENNLLPPKEVESSIMKKKSDQEVFDYFLSHSKQENGIVAQALKGFLKEKRVFLDVDEMTDLRDLESFIKNSKCFIILYSNTYFTKYWCLMEFMWALEQGKCIIPIHVTPFNQITPFDRREAIQYLKHLKSNLDDSTKVKFDPNIDLDKLGVDMMNFVSNCISIELNPMLGSGAYESVVNKIYDRV